MPGGGVSSFEVQGSKRMSDQRNEEKQQSGQRDQRRGGGQKPGEKQKSNKSGQAGKQQEELNKKWRDMAEPGQEPGTGSPGT